MPGGNETQWRCRSNVKRSIPRFNMRSGLRMDSGRHTVVGGARQCSVPVSGWVWAGHCVSRNWGGRSEGATDDPRANSLKYATK